MTDYLIRGAKLDGRHAADLIVEDGRIAERGSHDELMAAGGAYAELWARQANERREEEETDAEIAE